MTEAEWLACTDPQRMLGFLWGNGNVSERKFRLFACALTRRVWHLLTGGPSRNVIVVAERFADGRATEQERKEAVDAARELAVKMIPPEILDVVLSRNKSPDSHVACAALAATAAAYHDDFIKWGAAQTLHHILKIFADDSIHREGSNAIGGLIRHTFGNPFRPVTINPAWHTWNDGTVVKLAQAIYDERVFDRMPVLADALEESGCTDADILAHCRQPGEHVRGCWVVDAILGKE